MPTICFIYINRFFFFLLSINLFFGWLAPMYSFVRVRECHCAHNARCSAFISIHFENNDRRALCGVTVALFCRRMCAVQCRHSHCCFGVLHHFKLRCAIFWFVELGSPVIGKHLYYFFLLCVFLCLWRIGRYWNWAMCLRNSSRNHDFDFSFLLFFCLTLSNSIHVLLPQQMAMSRDNCETE